MPETTYLIYVLLLGLAILAIVTYLVFWRDGSGVWLFLLAICLGSCAVSLASWVRLR